MKLVDEIERNTDHLYIYVRNQMGERVLEKGEREGRFIYILIWAILLLYILIVLEEEAPVFFFIPQLSVRAFVSLLA